MNEHLEHFTCNSFAEHLRTLDRYTTLAAQELLQGREKWILTRMRAGTPRRFMEIYLLRQGPRDGYPGFVIASMGGVYVLPKYAKLWQMLEDRRHNRTI
jgi:hypothetical protein